MTPRARHVALVLDLLRPVAIEPGNERRSRDLAGIDWREVVAFSSAHFVVQALAPALGDTADGNAPAAIAFLGACREANADRNQVLRQSLVTIGQALNRIGVQPIALKGAAFLASADAQGPAAPWRFMQDLDLLVPEERLTACVDALHGLGMAESTPAYQPEVEAHYPPLLSPCGTFSVELHTRLFAHGDHGFSASAIRNEARPSHGLGETVLVPTGRHRIGHAVVHAQLHNRNHPRRRLVLKDVLDLTMLAREGYEIDVPAIDPGTWSAHEIGAAEALLAARSMCLQSGRHERFSPEAVQWASSAISRLCWPRWRKCLSAPLDHVRLETFRVKHETGHVRRRAALALSPRRLRDAGSVWRSKQRQYHWG